MNKIKSFLLLSFLIAANVVYVNAQKLSEGKAVFEISYPDSDIPDEQMAQRARQLFIDRVPLALVSANYSPRCWCR